MKKKVLFIVSDFYQGGAQRMMYEIDVALDKTKTDVTLLSYRDLNEHPHFQDYYYTKHLELGTKILFRNDILKTTFYQKLINKMFRRNIGLDNLKALLNSFDEVCFMGEYTFAALQNEVKHSQLSPVKIFIMSARFQGEHYRYFDKNNSYVFISGFSTQQEVAFEFEGFIDYKPIFFPLAFKIENEYKKWKFKKTGVKKIGIFTRLSKAKPLDPFFYAFQILKAKLPDTELHVFGAGDYVQAEYDRYINHLGLESSVKFRGHQENIKATTNEEELDLVWFQGYLNRPAGYAGFDICLTGVPQLFWDFYLGENENINDVNAIYPLFKDVLLFAEASVNALTNRDFAEQLSEKQYNDVINNRDIKKHLAEIGLFS